MWLFQKSLFPGSEKIYFPSKSFKISKKEAKIRRIYKEVSQVGPFKELKDGQYEGKTPVRLIYDNPLLNFRLNKQNKLKKIQ